MQLVADQPLTVDSTVVVEVGAHVVLAEVRHCAPRGGKFAIGLERVHVVFADTLAEHQNKAARIQALIEDYQRRMTDSLADTTADQEPAIETPIRESRPLFTDESPSVPAGSGVDEGFTSATDELVENTVAQSSSGSGSEAPRPEAAETVTSPVAPAETGLDAARSAAPETTHPRSSTRSRMIPLLVGAGVAAAAIALMMFASPFNIKHATAPKAAAVKSEPVKSEPVKSEPVNVPPKETARPVQVAQAPAPDKSALPIPPSAPHQAAPAASSVVQTASPSGKLHLSLKFTGPNWASACADGQKVFARAFSSGDTREVDFSSKTVLRLGSAGDVEATLDGKPVGSLGRIGQLRLLELSSAGFRPMRMRDPADDCVPDPAN